MNKNITKGPLVYKTMCVMNRGLGKKKCIGRGYLASHTNVFSQSLFWANTTKIQKQPSVLRIHISQKWNLNNKHKILGIKLSLKFSLPETSVLTTNFAFYPADKGVLLAVTIRGSLILQQHVGMWIRKRQLLPAFSGLILSQ